MFIFLISTMPIPSARLNMWQSTIKVWLSPTPAVARQPVPPDYICGISTQAKDSNAYKPATFLPWRSRTTTILRSGTKTAQSPIGNSTHSRSSGQQSSRAVKPASKNWSRQKHTFSPRSTQKAWSSLPSPSQNNPSPLIRKPTGESSHLAWLWLIRNTSCLAMA